MDMLQQKIDSLYKSSYKFTQIVKQKPLNLTFSEAYKILEKEASDVKVLNLSHFTEKLIICDAPSKQNRISIAKMFKQSKCLIDPDWILIDCNSFVVNIFSKEKRKQVDLENFYLNEKPFENVLRKDYLNLD